MQLDPEGNEIRCLRDVARLDGARVLEVGCGDGRLTFRHARSAAVVIAIDPARKGLHAADRARPPDLATPVNFAQATATALPFPRERFDLALLTWSL